MSSFIDDDVRAQSVQGGVERLLRKPVNPRELKQLVRDMEARAAA